MTGVRVELANPEDYSSATEYIQQHLAPLVAELHRLTNELLVPGSTAEELAVDMVPTDPSGLLYRRLDKRLDASAKHVTFDGSAYFTVPAELLLVKQAKVQLTAVVYAKLLGNMGGPVAFRLVREDGLIIDASAFEVTSPKPTTVTRVLPFGYTEGCIAPERHDYFLEARYLGIKTIPVCRRFSLAFVYI
jgi:hypothetical protein